MKTSPAPKEALLLIDMQRDFLPGGALPVSGSGALIPLINQQLQRGYSTIIATRDWHPANHCSFKSEGGPWPAHCIAGTPGAELAPRLNLPSSTLVFNKGTDPLIESYSAFIDANGHPTGLADLLKDRGIKRIYLCGVALDYCVKETALDGVAAGFETHLLASLTKAINTPSPTLNELKRHHIVVE